MDYDEYNAEYQKVILKEQLKRGLKIKTTLMDTLKTTDNKQYLEFFLQATDFDGYLANNEQALEDLGQDEEFKELIEQDTELINGLKKTAEDRLEQLKEQYKDKNKEADDETTRDEDEENDEHNGRSHNKEQNSSTIENDMDQYRDMPYFRTIVVPVMPRYGTDQYYIQSIKANVDSSINSMHRIKENIDRCPSPLMLAYMSGEREFFTQIQQFSGVFQNMPQCDEELRMLADEQREVAQQVKDTIDHYIEQYQEKFQESTQKKEDEERTFEDAEEQLQRQEELSEDNKEQEDVREEEFEEDDREQDDVREEIEENDRSEEIEPELEQDDIPRKSWELPPQQKDEIQRGQQQVAQEYNERQANPQPEIQQQSVEDPEVEM